MTQAEGPVPAGADSALHRLYRTWTGLKTEGRLPSCAAMEAGTYIAREPGAALLVVERAGARRRYRYRSVGTSHRAAMGREIVGFTLDDIVPPRILPLITRAYDRMVDDHMAHYWMRTLGLASGSAHAYERLMVPLADDGVTVDALLGVWRWLDGIFPDATVNPASQGYSV